MSLSPPATDRYPPIVAPGDVAALFTPIADAPREVAMFAYFDPEWRLLGTREVSSPDRDAVTIPLRDVIADALAFDATAVVMAHNHPSGDPTPSTADHALTRRLARALDAIGVRLTDHFVLTGTGQASFRALGWL